MVEDKTSVVVLGSSETVVVNREGQSELLRFDPGTPSTEIVTASLDSVGIRESIPPRIQNLIVYNINQIEMQAQESQSDEVYVELNLGLVKFGWKRKL